MPNNDDDDDDDDDDDVYMDYGAIIFDVHPVDLAVSSLSVCLLFVSFLIVLS